MILVGVCGGNRIFFLGMLLSGFGRELKYWKRKVDWKAAPSISHLTGSGSLALSVMKILIFKLTIENLNGATAV